MMKAALTLGTVSLLVGALVSCGGGGSGPQSPTATAVLTLTASPNPVVGGLCSGCGNLVGEREALAEFTIRESAGVGASVSRGSQELRNTATSAVVASTTFSASDFGSNSGTTRIPPGGQLVYRTGMHYPASHAGASLTFTLTIVARDDNGHDVTVTLAVPTTG